MVFLVAVGFIAFIVCIIFLIRSVIERRRKNRKSDDLYNKLARIDVNPRLAEIEAELILIEANQELDPTAPRHYPTLTEALSEAEEEESKRTSRNKLNVAKGIIKGILHKFIDTIKSWL